MRQAEQAWTRQQSTFDAIHMLETQQQNPLSELLF